MSAELLLDTGALVSLLDRSQTHHLNCRRAFAEWTGPVVSTEAVLTEATHLLAGVRGGRAACVDFFLSGGALLVPSIRLRCSASGSCWTSMPTCRWTSRMPRSWRWPTSSIARPCSRRIVRIFRSTESKAGSPFVSCRASELSNARTLLPGGARCRASTQPRNLRMRRRCFAVTGFRIGRRGWAHSWPH